MARNNKVSKPEIGSLDYPIVLTFGRRFKSGATKNAVTFESDQSDDSEHKSCETWRTVTKRHLIR